MDYATFRASIDKEEETRKAYEKALAKEEKIGSALREAKADTETAKEAYLLALEETKKVVAS